MARTNLDDLLAKASPAFRRLNAGLLQTDSLRTLPEPEPPVCNGALATPKIKALYSGRVLVRFTCHAVRLTDPDNRTVKFHLDCLRYAGIIRDDRPEDIELQVSQKKVSKKSQERTEITVEPIRCDESPKQRPD